MCKQHTDTTYAIQNAHLLLNVSGGVQCLTPAFLTSGLIQHSHVSGRIHLTLTQLFILT